jgi:two-component system, response regulator YesN
MHKLLIVDDEQIIRTGLRTMINKVYSEKFDFLEAENGKEAIEIIDKLQPDIVFTDIRMPEIDGLEVINWTIKNSSQKPVFVILSGYDDFNYAKLAIKYGVREYLLKPISRDEVLDLIDNILSQFNGEIGRKDLELLRNIHNEEVVELLKDRYFKILISETSFDKERVEKKLISSGVSFQNDNFKIIVIDHTDKAGKYLKLNDVDSFILDTSIKYWSFHDNKKRLVILLCGHDNFILDVYGEKIYKHIKRMLKDVEDIKMFAGIGSCVSGIENIKKSYIQALDASMYKVVKKNGETMEAKNINDEKGKYKNLYLYFPKVAEKTELRLRTAVSALLDEIFQEFNTEDVSVDGIIQFYNDINRFSYEYFTQKNIDFSMIFDAKENYFNPFEDFWDIYEVKSYIRRYLFKVCDIISVYKDMTPDKKIIDKIIRYLWENYNKDINLNIISEIYEKNNSYLSVLFKKETGKNFIDFLTDIRMEKAKEMLANSNKSIQEVSEAVGYPNAKYFSKVFNKVLGMSPKKYKKECI